MFDIVIVNYNNITKTERLLESLCQYPPPEGSCIILVDNNSDEPGTKDFLSHKLCKKNMIVIHNRENMGCAKARNIGASFGNNPIILFLDNDTEVLGRWAETIELYFKFDEIGIIGLKTLDRQHRITGGGFVDRNRLCKGREWKQPNGESILTDNIDVVYVNGACFAVKRKVFEALEGFDENYWFWYEDSDFCFRAREILGIKTFFIGQTWIYHDCNSSSLSDKCRETLLQSRERFYRRWKTC
jgi:GT2 family glycosyltransferase